MSEERNCINCGSTNLKESEVQSTGKIYSRPKEAKALAILTAGVPVSGLVCFDCGHLALRVDVEKMKKLL